MSLRQALHAFLLADAGISTMVGGVRVHPAVLPQGTHAPSLVYNVVAETTDHHMQGPSGLVMVRMQIDAYASLVDDADALAAAVKLRIDGFRGPMPHGDASPTATVKVQGIFADTARTDYFPDAELHRMSRDYLIWYEER